MQITSFASCMIFADTLSLPALLISNAYYNQSIGQIRLCLLQREYLCGFIIFLAISTLSSRFKLIPLYLKDG